MLSNLDIELDSWPNAPDNGKSKILYEIFHTSKLSDAYELAKKISEDDIKAELDPFKRNYILNIWEAAHHKSEISSYPTNISIPVADLCNARCSFCDSWLRGRDVLSEEKLELFSEALRFARTFGIQGHGEPLVNPNIEQILNRIGELVNPHARGFIITNGVHLEKYWELCLAANINTYNISLNAASKNTHQRVMGLGNTFDNIIKIASEIQKHQPLETFSSCDVTFSFVLTSENIEDAIPFVDLCENVGVSKAYLRTLLPLNTHPDMNTADDWYKYFTSPNPDGFLPQPSFQPGLNYHLLHPSNHADYIRLKEKLIKRIERSKISIEYQPEIWDVPALPNSMQDFVKKYPNFLHEYSKNEALKSRDLRNFYKVQETLLHGNGKKLENIPQNGENPLNRTAPMNCSFAYQNIIVNETNMRLVPCCNMAEVPGFEPTVINEGRGLKEQLNCDAMVNVRSTLAKGPLLDACKICSYNGL